MELDHNGWALKNGCFQIVMLEKTLESPLNSKQIKPVYPIEINPEYSLEWQMLKLKLQYFGHLMWRTDSLEKTQWCWGRLKAGGEGDNRGWDGWMASPIWWIWVWTSFRSWWWKGKPDLLQSMGSQRVMTEHLNWTEKINKIKSNFLSCFSTLTQILLYVLPVDELIGIIFKFQVSKIITVRSMDFQIGLHIEHSLALPLTS